VTPPPPPASPRSGPPLTLANFRIVGGFTTEGASAVVGDELQKLSQMSSGGILPDYDTVQSNLFVDTTALSNTASALNAQSNLLPDSAAISNAALALNAQPNSSPDTAASSNAALVTLNAQSNDSAGSTTRFSNAAFNTQSNLFPDAAEPANAALNSFP
jgi:hypothetical protein